MTKNICGTGAIEAQLIEDRHEQATDWNDRLAYLFEPPHFDVETDPEKGPKFNLVLDLDNIELGELIVQAIEDSVDLYEAEAAMRN